MLTQSSTMMILILAPVALITVLSAGDIVSLVYYRGNSPWKTSTVRPLALVGFAVGFPIIALRDLLIRVHFAYQETKSPMVISMLSVGVNVVLSILLSFGVGILGVTLATSLSAVVSVYFLNRGVKEMLPGFRLFFSMEKLWQVRDSNGVSGRGGIGGGSVGDL